MKIFYSIQFVLLHVLLQGPNIYGWILCPSNGLRLCLPSDLPVTINSSTVLSNCIYRYCPQIVLTNGSLVISNVTFDESVPCESMGGGALMMMGDPSATLSIRDSMFINCSASIDSLGGGAVFINGPFLNQVNISDTVFKNNYLPAGIFAQTGTGGGAIYVYNGVNIAFNKVKWEGNEADYAAGVLLDTNINFVMYDCSSISNSASLYAGFISLNINVNGIKSRCTSHNDYSAYTAFVFINNGYVGLTMTDIQVYNCLSFDAPVFYGWGPADVAIINMYVQGSVTQDSGYQNGHIFGQGYTNINMNNVTMKDVSGGLLLFAWTCNVFWTTGIVENFHGTALVFAFLDDNGSLITSIDHINVSNSVLFDCLANAGGVLQLSNMVMTNLTFPSRASGISNYKPMFLRNIQFYSAIIHDGSIFRVGAPSVMNDTILVRDTNILGSSGAIFTFTNNYALQLNNIDLSVKNYTQVGMSSPTFVSAVDTGFFMANAGVNNLKSASIDPGVINIQSPQLAYNIMNSSFYHDYFPSSLAFYSNVPCNLKILNQEELNNAQILVQTSIPDIILKAVNFFGDGITFNSIKDNTVIMQLVEVLQKASLSGETLKGILDPNTDQVVFSNVDIFGRKPGKYCIQARGVYNSLKPLPGQENNWPTVNITIQDCAQGTLFSPISGTCLPLYTASKGTSIGLAVFSIFSMAVLAVSLVFLNYYKNFNAVRANSYVFLTSMTVGSIIAISSIAVQFQPSSIGCMASEWLQNIGFVISLTSIIIKMYRLEKIFKKTMRKRNVGNLRDEKLLSLVILGAVIISAYLGFWTHFSPSSLVSVTNSAANAIFADTCSDSTYTYLAIFTRLMVTIIAAYFAYVIRNIPDNFNETRLIGFACYNWVVFGTLLNLLVKGYIQNPTVSFILNAISILFPHLSSTCFLVFIRIYMCKFYPQEAMTPKKQSLMSSVVPNLSELSSSGKKSVSKTDNNKEAEHGVIHETDETKKSSNNGHTTLYRIAIRMTFILALQIIYLLVWNFTSPSEFTEMTLDSFRRVIPDQCSTNLFTSISIAVRIFVSLGIAFYTYGKLKVSENFPEIRAIVLLGYNWLIFGGILDLISRSVIQSPETSFAFLGISVIFPALTTPIFTLMSINLAVTGKKVVVST